MSYMKNLYLEILEAAILYRENNKSFFHFIKDYKDKEDLQLLHQIWLDAKEYI